jgi:anhydro-N-acetylmuramic acid kinase
VQCVGCPGHTLWHDADGRFPHALTVGMPAVLAERLGVTVCSDFRGRDLAAGGQGAPLAALADYLLFRHPQEGRLLLHLGGVARLVHVPAGARLTEVRGFEAGPCSVLLDALMRLLTSGRESYDTGGRHAVQGRCLEPLLREWLRHPYLLRRPPKSLPRSAFTEEFAAQAVAQARAHNGTLHDLLCTATHFVARSVSESLARFLPPGRVDRVLVSGGAVRNGMLWQLLQQQLAPAVVERTDAAGLPAAYRKAMAFALLAVLLVDGVAANLPAVTGAAGSRLLGTLTPGAPGHWARCLAWMAAQTAPLAIAEEAE